MHPNIFIQQLPHDTLIAAIRTAEQTTSGRIHVLISHRAVADPVVAARTEFVRRGLARSPERNGVLIFVTPRTRKFAVIGDTGIHAKCGGTFWDELAQAMTGHFRQGDFSAGLTHGVGKAGELLAEHFPRPRTGLDDPKT